MGCITVKKQGYIANLLKKDGQKQYKYTGEKNSVFFYIVLQYAV